MIVSERSKTRPSGVAEKTDDEAKVSQYFKDYADSGKPVYLYAMQHPGESLRAFASLFKLPTLSVAPSANPEGVVIRGSLSRHSAFWRLTGFATAVLFVPAEAGEYSLGASEQMFRRKVKYAKRLGIYWTEVKDPGERQQLLGYVNEPERTQPDAAYRDPGLCDDDLLNDNLWLAAYAADGRPILLSITSVDTEAALIRCFGTLGAGEEQSNARYLMTEVLVERLSSAGVRCLIDGAGPFWRPNGLRPFQQMVGFRLFRVRIGRSGKVTG